MKIHTPSHKATEFRQYDITNFLGLWYNQHGSELEIKEIVDGKLKGTFKTAVGAHEADELFELTGFISGRLIGFSVNFGKHQSLTSWAGQSVSDNGDERIETMWHLARTLPESYGTDKFWAGIWTGADTFCRADSDAKTYLTSIASSPFAPSHPLCD